MRLNNTCWGKRSFEPVLLTCDYFSVYVAKYNLLVTFFPSWGQQGGDKISPDSSVRIFLSVTLGHVVWSDTESDWFCFEVTFPLHVSYVIATIGNQQVAVENRDETRKEPQVLPAAVHHGRRTGGVRRGVSSRLPACSSGVPVMVKTRKNGCCTPDDRYGGRLEFRCRGTSLHSCFAPVACPSVC